MDLHLAKFHIWVFFATCVFFRHQVFVGHVQVKRRSLLVPIKHCVLGASISIVTVYYSPDVREFMGFLLDAAAPSSAVIL